MKIHIAGVTIAFEFSLEPSDEALLAENFAAFEPAPRTANAQATISVETFDDQYRVIWNEAESGGVATTDRQELIYHVEGFVVLALQLARPGRLFLHAAVLSHQGKGFLLTGASGNGKSTLCWALTHHGCQYVSDELAPLAVLPDGQVESDAYPHSVNLKSSPNGRYGVPPETPYTGWTYHIPAKHLAGGFCNTSVPIHGIFLVKHHAGEPTIRQTAISDAMFQVYPNVLNGLAHSASGLSAVKAICQALPVFDLRSNCLDRTCQMVLEALHQ